MAVTAKKNEVYEYAPTRVYSYSRSAAAVAEPQRKEPAQKNGKKPEQKQKTRAAVQAKPQIKRAVLSMTAVAMVAAVMLFVITRYAAINKSYSALNEMKDNITAIEQEIEMLNVKLNTSVSLEAARAAAVEAGMGYPTEEQVVNLNGTGEGGR